jgi:hypothetical protein
MQNIRAVAGVFALVFGLLMFAPIGILGGAIGFPASLSYPTEKMLPLLLEQESAVRLGYGLYLLYSVLFFPVVWHTLEPNESLLVGKGVPHTFRIPSGTHATVQVEFSPALDTETVFRTMAKAGASGRINPLYIGLIATQTKAGFHFAKLPELIQHPMLHILAILARVQNLKLETTKE